MRRARVRSIGGASVRVGRTRRGSARRRPPRSGIRVGRRGTTRRGAPAQPVDGADPEVEAPIEAQSSAALWRAGPQAAAATRSRRSATPGPTPSRWTDSRYRSAAARQAPSVRGTAASSAAMARYSRDATGTSLPAGESPSPGRHGSRSSAAMVNRALSRRRGRGAARGPRSGSDGALRTASPRNDSLRLRRLLRQGPRPRRLGRVRPALPSPCGSRVGRRRRGAASQRTVRARVRRRTDRRDEHRAHAPWSPAGRGY